MAAEYIPEFISKYVFTESDIPQRLWAINWFAHCGEPLRLNLTMDVLQVKTWSQALEVCKTSDSDNASLEAQNQLTGYLAKQYPDLYRTWNDFVKDYKSRIIAPLTIQKILPFCSQNNLDIEVMYSVQWDILGALMENTYMSIHHRAFYFLELLMMYEEGHFPCGWSGAWPQGKLVIF